MTAAISDCPLFTSRHAHHSVAWSIPGVSMPTVCIACITERLENRGELSIHVKKVLGELQALLDSGSNKLIDILNSDKRVTDHLCSLLFNLFQSQDASVAQSSVDLLMTLITLTKVQDIHVRLLQRTIQIMMTSHNFLSSLPLLMFLGRLLHSAPSLCSDVAQSYGGFLEFLLGGMIYPDEMVKSATVYILVQVCSKSTRSSLPLPLIQNMCRHISSNLASAKSHDLTINLLGFIRHLLKNGMYAQCLLQADQLNSQAKGATFASAFKRVLLSQDELLQLSGVQCIAEVLTHHSEYGRVLLSEDIAEFMLEALSTKNELLLHSLFLCLNSLAGIDDFYSKCHVVYGVDPITSGLSTSLRLRNYDAAQIGFGLLGRILSRQPSGLPLFSSHQSLQKLLDLITTALQSSNSSVMVQATSTLGGVLSIQHVPAGFPMSSFLPLLALLLHHIEPLTPSMPPPPPLCAVIHDTTLQDQEPGIAERMNPTLKRLFTEVLIVSEKTHKFAVYCIELTGTSASRAPLVDQSDCTFLLEMFEETLLPVFLIHINEFDQPEPFTSIVNAALCQFTLLSGEAVNSLVERLAFSGFIPLVLEMKSKFGVNPTPRYQALCVAGNQFLEQLCFHIESVDDHSATYVKDILHEALPNINCSLSNCLQLLSKASGCHTSSIKPLGNKLSELQTRQFAVLALLYHTYSCDTMCMFPGGDVFKALSSFLSLNPNVHMLPPTTLRHLTLIYALCERESGLAPASDDLLVRGLKMVPNPSSLFVPHPHLLQWAFKHTDLVKSVARMWLHQWLVLLSTAPDDHCVLLNKLIDIIKDTSIVLECLLDFLLMNTHDDVVDVVINVLTQLVSSPSHSLEVYKSLQKALLVQRVEPLSDSSMCAILKALTETQAHCKCDVGFTTDIKLIYQVANIVTRAKEDDVMSAQVAQCGMRFIAGSLTENNDTKIPALLLNNNSLLQKLVLFVYEKKSPKLTIESCPLVSIIQSHNLLSAGAVHLIAELIDAQHKAKIEVSHSSPKPTLPIPCVISTLLSPLILVQVAGLQFWRVLFSNGGKTGCFALQDSDKLVSSNGLQHIRVLYFLVQNCLIKSYKPVQVYAAHCFTALVKYNATVLRNSGMLSICQQQWCCVLLHHLTDVYQTSTLPHHYVTCLSTMLRFELIPKLQLKSVAQLLYKALASTSDSLSIDLRSDISMSLVTLRKLDESVFSNDQWTTLENLLKF